MRAYIDDINHKVASANAITKKQKIIFFKKQVYLLKVSL